MAALCEIGLALGKSLAEVAALSAAEISVWLAFRRQYGLTADRLAGATATAGAYVGGCFGGKAHPRDLIPRFNKPAERDDIEAVRAWFDRVGR